MPNYTYTILQFNYIGNNMSRSSSLILLKEIRKLEFYTNPSKIGAKIYRENQIVGKRWNANYYEYEELLKINFFQEFKELRYYYNLDFPNKTQVVISIQEAEKIFQAIEYLYQGKQDMQLERIMNNSFLEFIRYYFNLVKNTNITTHDEDEALKYLNNFALVSDFMRVYKTFTEFDTDKKYVALYDLVE